VSAEPIRVARQKLVVGLHNPFAYREATYQKAIKLAAHIAANGGWRDSASQPGYGVYMKNADNTTSDRVLYV